VKPAVEHEWQRNK